jgi:hypothetical protein
MNPKQLPGLWPTLVAAILFPATASAQFNNEWVGFQKDNSKLSGPSNLGLTDNEEKDYAWGDVDQDGWTDLVCVRKTPFTSNGHRVNVLFMNEGGTLVNRTNQYATASDVPGDQGFNTPTNDRDVVLFDADNDGWLDIITCTTLSIGTTKEVSHPRIYINLGNDGGGAWQGFRYEAGRIPQLMSNGNAASPKFCSVDAGDVTGDGFADLYFGDYDSGSSTGSDLNDRLFINDGTGHFTDESTVRMTSQMLSSAFGNSVAIRDFNMDGKNDILKDTSLNAPTYVSVSYNDAGNEGFFNVFDVAYGGAPYHTSTGDLNNDGREDIVISDDGSDRYMYNTGTDAFGRVIWSAAKTFAFVTGGDDGFASNNLIVDLDGDGWKDIVICDVDVDIGGCSRRTHIYHNPGGAIGSQMTLKEEAQQANGGWRGVKGMNSSDLQGTHDVAVFDLDNDGDMDMVFGLCTGTDVWLNDMFTPGGDPTTPYCFGDGSGAACPCGANGAAGEGCLNTVGTGATLTGAGLTSLANDTLQLTVAGAPLNKPGLLLRGNNQVANPVGDGIICTAGGSMRSHVQITTGGTSTFTDFNGSGFGSVANTGGVPTYFQFWYRDPANPCSGAGFNFSNGVGVTYTP